MGNVMISKFQYWVIAAAKKNHIFLKVMLKTHTYNYINMLIIYKLENARKIYFTFHEPVFVPVQENNAFP